MMPFQCLWRGTDYLLLFPFSKMSPPSNKERGNRRSGNRSGQETGQATTFSLSGLRWHVDIEVTVTKALQGKRQDIVGHKKFIIHESVEKYVET